MNFVTLTIHEQPHIAFIVLNSKMVNLKYRIIKYRILTTKHLPSESSVSTLYASEVTNLACEACGRVH